MKLSRTVMVAYGMFALSLLSPLILDYFGVDYFIIALVPFVGFFITGIICIPGTARLIVSVAEKLEDE